MALVLADRVRETTTVTGTGAITLLGAVTGYQSFSTIGDANTAYYCISDQIGANWEVGIGTYTLSGTTLARTTVLASSNAGALVSFTVGTKDVFITYPSEKGVWLDSSGNATGFGTPAAFVATNVTGLPLSTGVTGTLPVANGGTGVTTSTGTGSTVLSASPTFTGTVSTANLAYTGTLTGGTGVVAIGTDQIYKDASGNVGIGTSSPKNTLHVIDGLANTTGDSLTTAAAQITGPNVAGNVSNATFLVATNDALGIDIGGSIGFAGRYSGTAQFTAAQIRGAKETATAGEYGGYLAFGTRANGTEITEKVRISGAGNVGIGTSSPVTSLTVQAVSGNGIKAYDSSATTTGTYPCIESIGSRGDANTTFGGKFGAGYRRNDGIAIATGTGLGYYAFGGQWGTGTTYNQTNFLYSASVVGVSEGSFTSATAMPTALVFSTGSTGTSLQSINTSYGTERMRIDAAGNVGIGTSSPLTKTEITGTGLTLATGTSNGLLFNRAGTASQVLFKDTSTDVVTLQNANAAVLSFGTNATQRMSISGTGSLILVGSTAQKATGTTWSNPSDIRLKDSISPYTKGLNELMQVAVKEWEYNGKGGTTEGLKGLGVIADEVMLVLPNTVDTYKAKLNADDEEDSDIKKFDATEITWLMLKSIQELKAIIDTQNARIEALEAN